MISLLANLLYILVIGLHLYFVVLEMWMWRSRAPKVFGISKEFAEATATLASNQGLYNAFLVVGLLTGFFAEDPNISHAFVVYSLTCVIAAGIWGGLTVNKRIMLVQAVPALAALALHMI